MNEKTLDRICTELASVLIGQKFGKIFTLSRLDLAIDFRLNESLFLFISVDSSNPRIYLIKRRLRDLEKQQIINALEQTGWHRGKAAEILGISPSTLYRRLRDYNLEGRLR